MSVEIVLVITLLYTVLIVLMVGIVISLTRVFKTWAWYALAAGLIVVGCVRLIGLVKLPAAIVRAESRGLMPTSFSIEQWLTVIATLTGVTLMVIGFAKLRSDLRRIGR